MRGAWERGSLAPRKDAYLDWAGGPGADYPPKYEEVARRFVLIRLTDEFTLDTFKDLLKSEKIALTGRADTDAVFKPLGICDLAPLKGSKLQHFVAEVDNDFIETVCGNEATGKAISRMILAQVLPEDAICDTGDGNGAGQPEVRRQSGRKKSKKADTDKSEPGTVVVGIIDEGLAFANSRFRRAALDSRVEFAWLQDGRCVGGVEGFGYGRELDKHEIDVLLEECTTAGWLDEDRFYRRAGLIDFSRPGHKAAAQRTSHGTHVMDLACGYRQGDSPADRRGCDKRPIICVQLPTRTVADTSGIGLEKFMLNAVEYILERANRIADQRNVGALPVVINFSSGVLAGPHDGTHPIETALDGLLSARRTDKDAPAPTELVLPSGNSHLSRGHAKIDLAARSDEKTNGKKELKWRVQPDDKTFSFLEIWLPYTDKEPKKDEIVLRVRPPGGKRSKPLGNGTHGQFLSWMPDGTGGDIVCRAYYEFMPHPDPKCGGGKGRFTVILLPTAFHQAPTTLAPSGTWTIRLANKTNRTIANINAWIQWDDRPLGYPRTGRQSYFIDEKYDRVDEITGRYVQVDNDVSDVRRAGSVNALGTGKETFVLGGYIGKPWRGDWYIADYSAEGPAVPTCKERVPWRNPPEYFAVSEASDVLHGVLAAGSRSGSRVAMNGTSVAAPKMTRLIADQLADGKVGDGNRVILDGVSVGDGIPGDQDHTWRRTTTPPRGPTDGDAERRPRPKRRGTATP